MIHFKTREVTTRQKKLFYSSKNQFKRMMRRQESKPETMTEKNIKKNTNKANQQVHKPPVPDQKVVEPQAKRNQQPMPPDSAARTKKI